VADIKRSGSDISLITWGPALNSVLEAAEALAAEGVEAEVVDLRSLVPLDREAVLDSVRKTGRALVASHAVDICSYTKEIAAMIQYEAFDFLDAPVKCVGALNGIAPQSHILEAAFLPDTENILSAAREIL
jgi:pyruvate/2-oxoglutarate/acetoin dehydrogenase E1 component